MLRNSVWFSVVALLASPAWADPSGKIIVEIDQQFAADAQKMALRKHLQNTRLTY